MEKSAATSAKTRTTLIVVVSIFIVAAVLVAMIPLLMTLFKGGGVKTEGIDADKVTAASTELDGDWEVTNRPGDNVTSAGFTFEEVLPGERRSTSASTRAVTGFATIAEGTLTAGEITVDMQHLSSDSDKRDSSVRRRIFHTDEYPEATFKVTRPADVSAVPEDGTVGTVELTGELTIHGETNEITHEFDVARSGDHLIVAGDIPINRLDYGVETPELVAAKIAEEGEVNVRINMTK
ncbi:MULTISPECIES: YceI family protein [unclassified Corynebacterium]|uniref:YceI family protein n=1 Tax=unclassified Corynebacterium TaxID=2624378 RepID=UPI001EF5113E|nr:YceI family protein [Corynebacterium sp. ACRPZ]MCG7293272.1 YceI family protein [Corynebacterium sp. ACRPY]